MSLSKTNSSSRIYVGNLPQFVRQRDLEDHFDKYGRVQGIDIHSRFDPAFAFIEFDDPRFVLSKKFKFLNKVILIIIMCTTITYQWKFLYSIKRNSTEIIICSLFTKFLILIFFIM